MTLTKINGCRRAERNGKKDPAILKKAAGVARMRKVVKSAIVMSVCFSLKPRYRSNASREKIVAYA
jgi:hypothetical protein